MAISSTSNTEEDDVSAAFDEEPADICSLPSVSSPNPKQLQARLTPKRRATRQPPPPSPFVDLCFNILRFASGITLSATSKLLQPSLHMTKSYVLPELADALSNYYHTLTPERVQLWLQILPTVLSHSIEVSAQTERGGALGTKLTTAASSGLETLSTDEVRRVILEYVTQFIKTTQALQTPEAKDALEHCAVLGCSWIDSISTSQAKQFIHDVQKAAWAAIELATDDRTTVALAQVTATLCHALESEQCVFGSSSAEAEQERQKLKQETDRNEEAEWSPIVPRISSSSDIAGAPVNASQDGASSSTGDPSLPTVIHTQTDPLATTTASFQEERLAKNPNANSYVSATEATQLFMQVFEEAISTKRCETIASILEKDGQSLRRIREQEEHGSCAIYDDEEEEKFLESYAQWWFPKAAAAAGAGNERGQDTLKVSSQIGVGRRTRRQGGKRTMTPADAALERYIAILGCVLLSGVLFCGVWLLLGFYGLYKFVFVPDIGHVQPPPIITSQPEVIVRIIREVVHVTPDGKLISRHIVGDVGTSADDVHSVASLLEEKDVPIYENDEL